MNTLSASIIAIGSKGTVLLACAWLVHLALRRAHPRLRIALWRAVAVALIALPLLHAFAPRWSAPQLDRALHPILSTSYGSTLAQSSVPRASQANDTTPVQTRRAPTMREVVAALWLFGIVLLGAYHLRSHLALRRLLSESRPAPSDITARADAIARQLGRLHDFELLVTAREISPLIVGLRRATIVVPQSLLATPRELDAVLAHELAHRAGSDHRWAIVITVARALWWPHPLAWGIGAAHRAACEHNSDAAAVRIDGDAAWYSSMLARLALLAAGAPQGPAISMMNGSEIMTRLRRLTGAVPLAPARAGIVRALGVGVLGVALALGTISVMPRGGAFAGPDESTRPDLPQLSAADADLVERMSVRGDIEARQALVPEVKALLASDDPELRARGISVLVATAHLKFDRTPLHDDLVDCLRDESPTVQVFAFNALSVAGGGPDDLDAIAPLADSPNEAVLEALGNSVFYFDREGTDPRRDAIVMRLLNHPSNFVVKETMRGSWGYPVGPEVEAKMIEVSRRPELEYDAVYFALSTRPVKSVAVAQRLIEVLRTSRDWNATYRCVWGLANWDAVPEAHELILDALIEQSVESTDTQSLDHIVRHLATRMCEYPKAKAALQRIADDVEQHESIRAAAREALARPC